MSATRTPKLIAALRETMREVERTSGVRPDDPAMIELKRILGRRVADLERGISRHRATPHSDPTANRSLIRQEQKNATSC